MANNEGAHLIDYGNPYGYLPLRNHIADTMLPEIGIKAHESQIVLTCGASQALDLVSRHLLKPGDKVLVDDPGYYNLFGNLRLQGLQLIGVPRDVDGPDLDMLESLADEHRPKLYFTQSVLQNPTGSTMNHHTAFRVLQAAERYGFRVVEDDIFSDMQPQSTPRLAALDQLDRVIYVRSFSKTLSGSLRVGFVACNQRLAQDLVDTKMVTSITTSQFTEKLLYRLLTEGYYRKYLSRLIDRVGEARRTVAEAFERMGLESFGDFDNGMFLWGRFADIDDSLPLAEHAMKQGVMLWRRALCSAPPCSRRPGCGSMLRYARIPAYNIGSRNSTLISRMDSSWSRQPALSSKSSRATAFQSAGAKLASRLLRRSGMRSASPRSSALATRSIFSPR
jgi:DNA-binding transcriptional MocR family regulator